MCQQLVFDSTNSKVIALYRAGGSNAAKSRVGTVSGTSITWGTESSVNAIETDAMDITYDPDTQRVIAITNDQSGGYIRSYVGTVSGTDITWGSDSTVLAADGQFPQITYDTENNKVVASYLYSAPMTYKVGTVTGGSTNSISWGTAANITATPNGLDGAHLGFDPFSKRVAFSARESSSQDVMVASGAVSGSTITWTSLAKTEDVAIGSYTYLSMAIAQKGLLVTIGTDNADDDLYATYANIANSSTNLTTENFVGFARESYANNTTAKIDVTGATNITQSGLTPGQQYFVQNNGTLDLTAATPRVYAGTAVASGKLIVGNDTPPIPVTQTVEHVATVNSTGQTYIEFTGITTSNVAKHVIVLNAITQGGSPGALANGLRAQVYLSGTYNNWLTANNEYDYRTTLKEWNTGTVENWYQNQNYFKINRDDSDYQISGEVTIYNNMFGASSGSTGDKWLNFDMFGSNTGFMNGKGKLDGYNCRQNQVTGIRFYSAASYWLHGRADLYRFSRPT